MSDPLEWNSSLLGSYDGQTLTRQVSGELKGKQQTPCRESAQPTWEHSSQRRLIPHLGHVSSQRTMLIRERQPQFGEGTTCHMSTWTWGLPRCWVITCSCRVSPSRQPPRTWSHQEVLAPWSSAGCSFIMDSSYIKTQQFLSLRMQRMLSKGQISRLPWNDRRSCRITW